MHQTALFVSTFLSSHFVKNAGPVWSGPTNTIDLAHLNASMYCSRWQMFYLGCFLTPFWVVVRNFSYLEPWRYSFKHKLTSSSPHSQYLVSYKFLHKFVMIQLFSNVLSFLFDHSLCDFSPQWKSMTKKKVSVQTIIWRLLLKVHFYRSTTVEGEHVKGYCRGSQFSISVFSLKI